MTDKINLDNRISYLRLSVRAHNALEARGVGTIRQLIGKTEKELSNYFPGLGKRGVADIVKQLAEYGLKLGMSESDIPIRETEGVSYRQWLVGEALSRVPAAEAIKEADRVIALESERAKEAGK